MPNFSARSRRHLATCHPDLQRLFAAVIEETDCAVICGFRSRADQEAAYRTGASRLRWPKSAHNQTPSRAADVVPWPLGWEDLAAFDELAVVVKACAKQLGIAIVWGGDWKDFCDRPHYELAGRKLDGAA